MTNIVSKEIEYWKVIIRRNRRNWLVENVYEWTIHLSLRPYINRFFDFRAISREFSIATITICKLREAQ